MGCEPNCFDVKQASKLDNPGRIRELRPRQFLASVAGVAKGMVCVDFGSGTGVFAIPMAKLVGAHGIVYAVDSSTEMLGHIRHKNPPANLVFIQSEAEQTGLNSQIADVCLLAFILHEVKSRESLIAEAFRLLKPGGRLVIVEWKPELDSPGPPKSVRIKKEQIVRFFKKSGINLVEFRDWSKNHYLAVGEK